ncbi:MAG TPA: Flp pilus assembly protein CpaB [Planctomycetaceae bacterium]|nr:Flp pilus assembly protein CpaB [Planctomycetaceae bacterium]
MKLTPWMLTVAAFAIICLLATLFVFKKLWATEVVVAPKPESRTLPMAITEIEPGTVITMKHIGNGRAEPGAKLSADTFLGIDSVVGRIAKERIPAAVPLQGSMFYPVGDYPDLEIEEGKRAVTVDINDSTAILTGMIKPGQYVDVHITTGSGNGNQLQSNGGSPAMFRTGVVATLFEGVKVVSVNRGRGGNSLQNSGGGGQNITLELDEDQARVALLAQNQGQLSVTYNPSGPGSGGISVKSKNDRISMAELMGEEPPEKEKKPFKIEHYRGGGRSTSYWRDGERVDGATGNDPSANTPLQGSGSMGDWSTDNKPKDRNNDLTQQPATAGTL